MTNPESVRAPTRISFRRVGSVAGKKAALPATLAGVLDLATQKLELSSPATRIFSADGDEYDADCVDLIGHDEVIYVSCGEVFEQPSASTQSPATELPSRAAAKPSLPAAEMPVAAEEPIAAKQPPSVAAKQPPSVAAKQPPSGAAKQPPLPVVAESTGPNPFAIAIVFAIIAAVAAVSVGVGNGMADWVAGPAGLKGGPLGL